MNSHILRVVSDRCQQLLDDDHHPIVIFDLDATLFDNTPRTRAILSEYADSVGYHALKSKLSSLTFKYMPYDTRELLKRLETPEQHIDAAIEFWRTRFFTNEYQRHDVATVGAPLYVQHLHEMGVSIVYLSGRDVPGMMLGCAKSLHEHQFPIGLAGTHLFLKPRFEMNDNEFKISTFDRIHRMGQVVAAFDNEPGLCNAYLNRWPDSHTVLMDTHCAPGAPPLSDGIPKIVHFRM